MLFVFAVGTKPYRHSVGQKGICGEPGSILYLRFFACTLDLSCGYGDNLSLSAGIKCVDVLWTTGWLCSCIPSAACTIYPDDIHKEE